MMSANSNSDNRSFPLAIQKWGGLACFLLAAAFVIAPAIYLFGDLRDPLGLFGYALADFLFGPVWSASLVTMVVALGERMSEKAPRRMSLALLAAFLAAAAMVAVACIRSANRHYHLIHPELHLEDSSTVLILWTTLVAGMTGAGWHFLGWTWLLVGSAGLSSGRLPRFLGGFYLVAGITSLFVYVLPESEGSAGFLSLIVTIWQGILLLRAGPEETRSPEIGASQPDRA